MIHKFQIIIKDTLGHVAVAAAQLFATAANCCVTERGCFTAVISGGSTPRPAHRWLAKEPYRSIIPWDKTHIFWVDERCVPKDNPVSNFGMAKSDLLDRIPIPEAQIHPMPGEVTPEDGAVKYDTEIKAFFQLLEGQFPIFDLVFLGLGADGHTASLFSGQRALEEREKLVVAVKGGNPHVDRLTLTFPVLNRARQIVILVSGKEKAAVLKALVENGQSGLPVQNIKPVNENVTLLVDRDAASLLTEVTTHE